MLHHVLVTVGNRDPNVAESPFPCALWPFMLTRTTYRRASSGQSPPPSIKETHHMSNRAMKFAAVGAIAAVALTGCGSSSGSKAASTTSAAAPAPTSAAAPAQTTAAAPAPTSAVSATSAAVKPSATSGGATGGGFVGVILPDT